MKAIFAVTALAAAISGQALAADTETTYTFTGTMDTALSIDLANDAAKDVALADSGDDEAGYEITMDIAIVNGPFSGSIGVEAIDSDDDDTTFESGDNDLSDTLTLTIGDLIVTEGNLSFGQVGSLMTTDEYTHEMAENGRADVTAGFKYVVAEGVAVQLQNAQDITDTNGSSYGVAAQYTGTADALSYVVEAEYNATDAADVDASTFMGAGVTYTTDAVTVTAALNNYGSTEKVTEYAAKVESTLAGATVSAAWTDPDAGTDDDEIFEFDASYAVSEEISVSAGYWFTTAADAGDEVNAGVAYAAGMLSASADVTLSNFDAETADSALIELNVTYTTESGVELYGDYAMQAAEAAAIDPIAEQSLITLGARYAF